MSDFEKISKVLEKYSNNLIQLPEVTGLYVGQTDQGELCIKIMVIRLTDTVKKNLPNSLDGFPVEIEVSGEIKPLH